MREEKVYPSIVIGLGVAGVTASIYLSRMGVQPLTFESDKIGGHVLKLKEITDYAGFYGSGEELAQAFKKQLEENEIETIHHPVSYLGKEDGLFVIRTDDGRKFLSKSVVIASGLKHKNVIESNLPIFTDPLKDREGVKDEIIAVVGGGRLAYQAVIDLSKTARKVYLIRKRSEAPWTFVRAVTALPNVQVIEGEADAIPSDVSRIYDLPSKSRMIGNTDFCSFAEIKDDQRNIAVDSNGQSFIKGVFAAGDVVQKGLKTLATSVYDGAIAGVMIYRLLTGMDQVS